MPCFPSQTNSLTSTVCLQGFNIRIGRERSPFYSENILPLLTAFTKKKQSLLRLHSLLGALVFKEIIVAHLPSLVICDCIMYFVKRLKSMGSSAVMTWVLTQNHPNHVYWALLKVTNAVCNMANLGCSNGLCCIQYTPASASVSSRPPSTALKIRCFFLNPLFQNIHFIFRISQ